MFQDASHGRRMSGLLCVCTSKQRHLKETDEANDLISSCFIMFHIHSYQIIRGNEDGRLYLMILNNCEEEPLPLITIIPRWDQWGRSIIQGISKIRSHQTEGMAFYWFKFWNPHLRLSPSGSTPVIEVQKVENPIRWWLGVPPWLWKPPFQGFLLGNSCSPGSYEPKEPETTVVDLMLASLVVMFQHFDQWGRPPQ